MNTSEITEADLIKAGKTCRAEAWHRGYVSRKSTAKDRPATRIESIRSKYNGAYRVLAPSFDSTQYCKVRYYW